MRFSRLPGREFRQGGYRTAATPFFSVKAKKNGMGKWRAGVVAGTAVHKSAAKRNFWKRQTMGILRALPERPAPRGAGSPAETHDVLVILFSKVNGLTKRQFQEKLTHELFF